MQGQGDLNSQREMAARYFAGPSSDGQKWDNREQDLRIQDPVLTPQTSRTPSAEQRSSYSPNLLNPQTQPPYTYNASNVRAQSRSPNMHVRTPSQLDAMAQENAQLRQRLEELREERDRTQDACEKMLTKLMTTEDLLQECQQAVREKDTELHVLHEQLARQVERSQPIGPNFPGAGRGLDREDERELRDLRLRCSRLETEARRKDYEIAQSRNGMFESGDGRNSFRNEEVSHLQRRVFEADERAGKANNERQAAENQAKKYHQQLFEWKAVYDDLKASHDSLHASHQKLQSDHSQASREIQEGRSKVNDQATQQLRAAETALIDARQTADFFKKNSERLSKRNQEMMDQMRPL